jgi:hypothetical protein
LRRLRYKDLAIAGKQKAGDRVTPGASFSAGVGAFIWAALGMRMLPAGKRRQSAENDPAGTGT